MTYKEMYDHLANDLKKVQIKEDYLRQKAIRDLKKERRFPAWKWPIRCSMEWACSSSRLPVPAPVGVAEPALGRDAP